MNPIDSVQIRDAFNKVCQFIVIVHSRLHLVLDLKGTDTLYLSYFISVYTTFYKLLTLN